MFSCSSCAEAASNGGRGGWRLPPFEDEVSLLSHITSEHVAWVPFECCLCPMLHLPTEHILQLHYEMYHPGRIPKAIYTYEKGKAMELRRIFAQSSITEKAARTNNEPREVEISTQRRVVVHPTPFTLPLTDSRPPSSPPVTHPQNCSATTVLPRHSDTSTPRPMSTKPPSDEQPPANEPPSVTPDAAITLNNVNDISSLIATSATHSEVHSDAAATRLLNDTMPLTSPKKEPSTEEQICGVATAAIETKTVLSPSPDLLPGLFPLPPSVHSPLLSTTMCTGGADNVERIEIGSDEEEEEEQKMDEDDQQLMDRNIEDADEAVSSVPDFAQQQPPPRPVSVSSSSSSRPTTPSMMSQCRLCQRDCGQQRTLAGQKRHIWQFHMPRPAVRCQRCDWKQYEWRTHEQKQHITRDHAGKAYQVTFKDYRTKLKDKLERRLSQAYPVSNSTNPNSTISVARTTRSATSNIASERDQNQRQQPNSNTTRPISMTQCRLCDGFVGKTKSFHIWRHHMPPALQCRMNGCEFAVYGKSSTRQQAGMQKHFTSKHPRKPINYNSNDTERRMDAYNDAYHKAFD